MTTLEERLNNLKSDIEDLYKEDGDLDIMDKNFDEADLDLDKINTCLLDLKNANKLTVEEQEKLFEDVGKSVEQLEIVVRDLKLKIQALKWKQIEQNKKIKKISILCVGGGLFAGITLTMTWTAIRGFMSRYRPTPTTSS